MTIYESRGGRFLQISDFKQQVRSKSKFPDPDINCVSNAEQMLSTSRSRISESKTETESKPVRAAHTKNLPSENPLSISPEEFTIAWERHKFYSGNRGLDADKSLVLQTILSMSGQFDAERFREHHSRYCWFHEHTKKPWAEFGVLSMLSWVRAGMPLPPKTRTEQDLEDIENAYPEENSGHSDNPV